MSFPRKRESSINFMKDYYVYILTNKRNGTLYIGVTNDLIRRRYEHKNNLIEGFTKKYNIHKLVYYEQTNDSYSAIQREKRLKKWNRQWKLKLIEKSNPQWKDLYTEITNNPQISTKKTGFPLSRE